MISFIGSLPSRIIWKDRSLIFCCSAHRLATCAWTSQLLKPVCSLKRGTDAKCHIFRRSSLRYSICLALLRYSSMAFVWVTRAPSARNVGSAGNHLHNIRCPPTCPRVSLALDPSVGDALITRLADHNSCSTINLTEFAVVASMLRENFVRQRPRAYVDIAS